METVKLRPLCHALDFNTTRIEQWLSRGYLKLKNKTTAGQARQITQRDAAKILTLVELVDAGFDAAHVYREVESIGLFRDDEAFLLISTGYLGELIPATEGGAPAPSDEDCERIYRPGELFSELIKASELHSKLIDRQRHVSTIVNMDAIEQRVQAAWKEIGQ